LNGEKTIDAVFIFYHISKLKVKSLFKFKLAKKCSSDKIYTECATNCPKTCQNMHLNFTGIDCKDECSPGCVCPEGFYIDSGQNNACVRESECTCLYQEKFYDRNEKVIVDCNEWFVFNFFDFYLVKIKKF